MDVCVLIIPKMFFCSAKNKTFPESKPLGAGNFDLHRIVWSDFVMLMKYMLSADFYYAGRKP